MKLHSEKISDVRETTVNQESFVLSLLTGILSVIQWVKYLCHKARKCAAIWGSNLAPLDNHPNTLLTRLTSWHCHTYPMFNKFCPQPPSWLGDILSYPFMLTDVVLDPHWVTKCHRVEKMPRTFRTSFWHYSNWGILPTTFWTRTGIPLQTVQIQISLLLKNPSNHKQYCLPICSKTCIWWSDWLIVTNGFDKFI